MRATSTPLLASLLVSLLATFAARAQAPGWQAATAIGTASPGTSEILHTAPDARGNVVVAGEFQGAITLGSTTLSSPSTRVPFVAKWNTATRAWVWAHQLSSTETAYLGGLAVAGSSVYVSGAFKGTAAAGTISLSNPNNYNTFVAKLTDADTLATWTWARQAGGIYDDYGNGLAVQGTSVYASGLSYSPVLSFGNFSVSSANSATSFVAKLTDTGPSAGYVWAVVPTGIGFGWLRTLAVQGTSIYGAGRISGTQTFGSTTLPGSYYGDNDVLVAKLTDAGTTPSWVWAQRAGGTNDDEAVALAATSAGVYLTGTTSSTTAPFGGTTLTGPPGTDVFVAKLTEAGTTASWAWAQRAGGSFNDEAKSLVVRGSNVYVSGDMTSMPATFGSISLMPTSNGAAFVARLADNGPSATWAWAQAVSSPRYSTASGLCSSGQQVYLSGAIYDTTPFGSLITVGTPNVRQGFLAAITDAAVLLALAPPAAVGGIKVFPNPAHQRTTVQLPAGLAAGPATLTVCDAVGRVVRSCVVYLPTAAPATDLDVAGLAPGLYVLRVVVGGSAGIARLVVE